MIDQKISFGKYVLSIDRLGEFSNAFFNGRKNPPVEFDELCKFIDKEMSKHHVRQNKGGVKGAGKRYWGQLNERNIKKLELIAIHYNEGSINTNRLLPATTLPEEVLDPDKYQEGATKKISVNVYERNTKARKKCIEHYGNSCSICDFNFGEIFGSLGEGFIHVHHLKPLAEIKESYSLDPIEDLRPVCPNCHSMLHRQSPALSIEALINLRKS